MSEKVTFTESLPLLLVEMFWLDHPASSKPPPRFKSEKWKFVYKENMRHCHSFDPQHSTISWSCSWLNLKLWTACHGHQNSTCFTNSLMIISSCGISTNFACVWQHPANGHWGNSKGCDGISSDVWEVLHSTQLWCMRSTSQYRSCHFQIPKVTVSTSDCTQ